MKKNIILILVAVIAFGFSSCKKTYDVPEFSIPKYTGSPANKTIQDIKWGYNPPENFNVDSVAGVNDEPFIIKAVVVSSDAGGNFYKTMVVQDSTGAISIAINKTGLYTEYQVGQVVYIKCNGLCVDLYGKGTPKKGYYRMGWIYRDGVGQINANFLNDYIKKDGLPNPDNVRITEINYQTADQIQFGIFDDLVVGNLVHIQNCEFAEESKGEPFAYELMTTEHKITNVHNLDPPYTPVPLSKFVVRTSNYAKFRNVLVPDSICSLKGILSRYGDVYQLELRTKEDIITD